MLGEEDLSEVLGRFGYFGKPTEALVWEATGKYGERFVTALNEAAKKSASYYGTPLTTAPTLSRLEGEKVETPATDAAKTDTSSNVKGWIDSAFGWLKTGSDIGIDWATLYKNNPGAKVDANGNLVDANGNLLAMAGTNNQNQNSGSNNTILYISLGLAAVVVLGVVFMRPFKK